MLLLVGMGIEIPGDTLKESPISLWLSIIAGVDN